MTGDLKVAAGALVVALVFAAGVTMANTQLRYERELSVGPVMLGASSGDSSPVTAQTPARSPAGNPVNASRAPVRPSPQPAPPPPSPPPVPQQAPTPPAPAPELQPATPSLPPALTVPLPALTSTLPPPSDGTATVQGTVPPPTVQVDRDVYTSHTYDYRGDDGGDQSDGHD